MSNKAHGMTVDVVARVFPEAAFKVVFKHRPGTPKPDPTVLLEACEVAGLNPEHTLFVGDTTVDMERIRAGMKPIGVGWGITVPLGCRKQGQPALQEMLKSYKRFGSREVSDT